MKRQTINLNIWDYLPVEIWNKIPSLYAQLNGWKGFGKGGNQGEKNLPYWFSFQENEKHILASVESSGLSFEALMNDEAWEKWVNEIKILATKTVGFKIGEIERGEVGYEIEWINKNVWTTQELLNIETAIAAHQDT